MKGRLIKILNEILCVAYFFAFQNISYSQENPSNGKIFGSQNFLAVEPYGQIGSGGLKNYAIAAYTTIDAKTRLVAFSSGCRKNKNILSLYEKIADASDGAPIFKYISPVSYPDKNEKGQQVDLDCMTFSFHLSDGNIYGFFRRGNDVYRAKFDDKTSSFVGFGKPLRIGIICGISENPDGSIFLYSRSNTILKKAEADGLSAWNPLERYQPFDGSMIWRGQEVRQYLTVRKLPSIFSDDLSPAKKASPSDADAVLLLRGGTFSDDKKHMFVGTREGLILHYVVRADGTLESPRPCIETDVALRAPNINNAPTVVIRDGKPDLITGGEGGLFYYKFEKFSEEGVPVYSKAVRVRQTNTNMYFGSLPVVDAVDFDKDGLVDIVAGNSDGSILWAKNIGKSGFPKFSEPKYFKKLGENFCEKGGYWNLQGPVETIYGYIAPTIFDWDGDGLSDILTGDNSSRFGVYFNLGNGNFSDRKLLYCDGVEVHGTWRQRPAVALLNDGTVAYAMFDWDDQLRLYRKLDKRNLLDCGKLLLTDGNPINATGTRNGESGRVKLSFADINGDGRTDLLLGTIGCNSVPNFENGIPRHMRDSRKKGASVLFLKNVGDDKKPVFEYPRVMTVKQTDGSYDIPNLGWHSCSADMVDFGNGERGIVVGMEDGDIIYWNFKDIKWTDFKDVSAIGKHGISNNKK